jgi:hypothetical protein
MLWSFDDCSLCIFYFETFVYVLYEFCLEKTYHQNKVEKKDENSEINDGSHV